MSETAPTVVLVHGWGFGPGIWERVRATLDQEAMVHALDLGFFRHARA